MKVPTLEAPKINNRPIGAEYSNLDYRSGVEDIAKGIGDFGQSADKILERHDKALAEADTTQASTGLGELQRDGNSALLGESSPLGQTPGFLSLRGEEAVKNSAPTLEKLQKLRDKISEERMQNPRQRRLFDRDSQKIFEGFRSKVEGHTSTEFQAARKSEAVARLQESMRSVGVDPFDEKEIARQETLLTGPIHANSDSEEQANAALNKWRGDVAKLQLDTLDRLNDWKGAQELYEKKKGLLGADAPKYLAAIGKMRNEVEAEQKKDAIISMSRDFDTGFVSSSAAEDALTKLEDGPLKDEVRKRLEHQLIVEDGRKKEVITEARRHARAQYNVGGLSSVPRTERDHLNQLDPDYFGRMEDDADIRYRRHKAEKTGDAAFRREQARINKLALQHFLAKPPEERASLNVDDEYMGQGVDDVGLGDIKVKQRQAKDSVDKTFHVGETEFWQTVKAKSKGVLKTDDQMTAQEGYTRDWYQRYRREHDGKEPTRQEMLDFAEQSVAEEVTAEPWYRRDKREYPAERWQRQQKDRTVPAPTSAPAGKAPKTAAPAADDDGLVVPLVNDELVVPLSKLSRAERAKQLARDGLTREEGARKLLEEGYSAP